jgi:hypothetical protein
MQVNNSIKQNHLEYLSSVMDKGIELMERNPTNETFVIWHDYVKNTLQNIAYAIGNQELLQDYLNFMMNIMYLSPFEKFKMTIRKLLEYYRFIRDSNY